MVFIVVLIVLIIFIAIITRPNDTVRVKSRVAVERYSIDKYFRENQNRIYLVEYVLKKKKQFKLRVLYVSPAGRKRVSKSIYLTTSDVEYVKSHPELFRTAAENREIAKEQKKHERERQKRLNEESIAREKARLEEKQLQYYSKVNEIIDYANQNKEVLIIQKEKNELDNLIGSLFDRTVNGIRKVKDISGGEWGVIENYISSISYEIHNIINKNTQILEYYNSDQFKQIKNTCSSLMDSQKEFNEYIEEKAQSISLLFGTRIIRNETSNEDRFNYIRPYKKTITPFTAEVSSSVFASAENKPMEYIVKLFYPLKSRYPEQIQKLKLLIGELETLKEARQIIDNYKKDYQQFLSDVPEFIIQNDEEGFYERLGFANISESVLNVEYKFVYTSNGYMAQRSFSVPMTEDNIIELIETLENKLTMESFTNDQRALMTRKLRNQIKKRDNYTCQICGNSTYKEPNLLLEVDHIHPISKGGYTIESNLQTLCWKCNRAKSNKI